MVEIKYGTANVHALNIVLLSHSKKLCLDMELFRPLFHTFLNLLVCHKAPKCYFSKFDSNATIIDGITLWKIRDVT